MSELIAQAPMTEQDFALVFGKLALKLQRGADVDTPTIKSYYEELAAFPLEAVQAAATFFAREPGRVWLPTTAEWCGHVQVIQRQALQRVVPQAREKEWDFDCDRCSDTGWVMWPCDGGGEQWPEQIDPNTRGKTPWAFKQQERATATPRAATCNRRTPHLPHEYVEACPCRPTNRTYQRHHGGGA